MGRLLVLLKNFEESESDNHFRFKKFLALSCDDLDLYIDSGTSDMNNAFRPSFHNLAFLITLLTLCVCTLYIL